MNSAAAQENPKWIQFFLCVTFVMFAVRDGATGVIRYLLNLAHLDSLWFVADLFAFVAFGLFVLQMAVERKNPFAIFFVLSFFFSLWISLLTTNDTIAGFFSSIKMFVPIFVGLAFGSTNVTDSPWALNLLRVVLVATVLGLILNPYFDYPWVGQTFSSITGDERVSTKIWWAAGGAVRYGGLAGDSTMAAYMTTFLYALLARQHSFFTNVLIWPFLYWAIINSTSKTALGVISLAIALYLVTMIFRNRQQQRHVLSISARLSFLCLLIPLVLMIAVGGVDLGKIDYRLASLADRINNTWGDPFVVIANNFPLAIFTGCGMGCFTYPMAYTSYADWIIPLDNFYLATFLMMGFPFLIFIYAQYNSARLTRDPARLILMVLMNIYTVTVQCYGPSFATLMIGYIFSYAFSLRSGSIKLNQPEIERKYAPISAKASGPAPAS